MRFILTWIVSAILSQSICLAAQIAMPAPVSPGALVPSDDVEFSKGQPTLYDYILTQTRASIFGDYLRSVSDLRSRLADRNAPSTVLVPTNKAVLGMSRKPHQGPPQTPADGEIQISDQEYDERSRENVLNWLSAHIIPEHPVSLSSDEPHKTLLDGKTVKFTSAKAQDDEWKHYVMYPDVQIINKIEAANGVIYMIEGTVTLYEA